MQSSSADGSPANPLNLLPLIEAKRDGAVLATADLRALVGATVAGRVPDYQLSAFLMAVLFRGLDAAETRTLTLAMRDSGDVLAWPADSRPVVDKHSTGGVGDKVSLPLAPLLACLGFRVPMISGRGLGLTGGTLDKLESIPGLRTDLEPKRIVELVQRLGLAMAGQTATMVPADKIIYALRDATGAIPSIPLLTSSILSKKLAEGIGTLVMDVKFGAGAFLPRLDDARALARAIVSLAKDCGVRTRALITDMETPLGHTAGNWLEVRESVACLEGRGPADLRELVLALAAHVLLLTQRQQDFPAARAEAKHMLESGEPRRRWNELIAAQGADLNAFQKRLARDHTAPVVHGCRAPRSGFLASCDARVVGKIVRDLGGGRLTQASVIDPEVGLDELVKPGQQLRAGDLLGRIHARDAATAEQASRRFLAACVIADEPPAPRPLVAEVVSPP